jgi:hypothetical protein
LVIDFAEKYGHDPLKSELFALLQQQLLGSISGDLTVCNKLDVLHCDDLARVLKSRMTKGTVFCGFDHYPQFRLIRAEAQAGPDRLSIPCVADIVTV